ncbi:MAG: RagB/SusD family nutrient uptake outer membrane protein [Bacteroidales bacterium]|nr:RagB/SusD family nutrient uptake outer membrane protein [Bacteroidales bacterium]
MKHNQVTLLSMLCLLAVSCDGFLDKYPTTSLSSGTMFKSQTTAETVVTGAYNQLRYGLGTQWATNLDCFSDVFDPDVDRVGTSYTLLNGSATATVDMFNSIWKAYYEGINRANDVINNFDAVPATEEFKACRIAEAKFIRAFWYYRLNSLWRGVPVYTKNLAPDQYTKKRSSEAEVWQLIVDDLTDCINCPSLPDKIAATSSDYGRITKGAAYALRGKVYLWLKKWALAEADFKKVKDCGYGLFNGSYADLFKEANERCDEMIFSVQMVETSGYGNAFSYNYGNHCTAGTGQNAYTVSTRFVDSFLCADGKPFSWDNIIPGFSAMPAAQRRVFFLRDGMTTSEKTAQANLGADMSKYLDAGNEARIKAAYAGRDPRLAAIAITPYSEYIGGVTGANVSYIYRYPFKSRNAPTCDLETAVPSNFYYPIRKLVAVGTEHTQVTYNPTDIPIIRYADVLLGLAEALNEQGNWSDAVDCVNLVRARAGVAPLNDGKAWNAVASSDDLRPRIRAERKWELAGEQVLYADEIRWGTVLDDKYSDGNGLMHAWGDVILQYSNGGPHYAVWPLPQSEIERNPRLEQNEGWIM